MNNSFVKGYYEYVEGKNGNGAFTDMNNKIISNNIDIASIIPFLKDYKNLGGLQGQVAFKNYNKLIGKVRLVKTNAENFKEGDILVSEITSPQLIPLIKKAKAVITQNGGIMSHAAIVSRELKVPTIVGVKGATKILKNGMTVEMDFILGSISIL